MVCQKVVVHVRDIDTSFLGRYFFLVLSYILCSGNTYFKFIIALHLQEENLHKGTHMKSLLFGVACMHYLVAFHSSDSCAKAPCCAQLVTVTPGPVTIQLTGLAAWV